MATIIRDKRIKSAIRVLEVLEMFDDNRQTITVMDVSRSLEYPQSSTSELLSCLVKQGYLTRDRSARTYSPTARVALLGAWVQPNLFRYGRLLPMMDDLHTDTDEAIVLGSIVGVALKHVHVVGHAVFPRFRTGTEHHLLHSPLGQALLSMTDRELVRKLTHRLNAEGEADRRIRYEELAISLDQVRSRGYAVGEIGNGMSALSVLLPQAAGQERLSLAIIAVTDTLEERRDTLVRELRGAVSRHLGPMMAHARPRLEQQPIAQAS